MDMLNNENQQDTKRCDNCKNPVCFCSGQPQDIDNDFIYLYEEDLHDVLNEYPIIGEPLE